MNPAYDNFKASLESLDKFNTEYIQANRTVLETRSPTQVPVTSMVSASTLGLATSGTGFIVINDYIRLCRVYCIMLWTYWEALGIQSTAVEELRLVRNCLVHHEGDMARYSQATKPKWKVDGSTLISLSKNKGYAQGYSIVISNTNLIYFTNLIKTEFFVKTGIQI